ncbi:MAG: hypothetical protein IKF00_09220 [Solobacterium sp.]|nr:hypothetical protein [Solobacterium sp.]
MKELITCLNYVIQGLVYWYFFSHAVTERTEKKHVLMFVIMCVLLYPLDLLIAHLPGSTGLMVKMLAHMALFCVFLYCYLVHDWKKTVLLVVIVIAASALSEVFAALLWGGLISLEFDTFITSTWYDMGLFYLSVDAMEFLVLLLILKLMQRKQKSKLTNQVWLLGTSSILFQTLAWGNLSYMNTAPDTKAPVPSIVIIILLLLSTAGTLMAVRRMLKEQKMLAQKEKLDQTSEHLDEQYVYLNQQKEAINRVRSTINDYKINFTEDLSVDTVHESTMDYLNEQYSDNIVLNTLLKYYGKKFDEQNIPHQFRILCSMRDVLPEDKIVIIFASLLDHISGSADLTLNTAKGIYRIDLVTGSSSAGIMKHLASSLEQELDGFYPAVNITSGQNTNVSVIFQKGGSHEAQ